MSDVTLNTEQQEKYDRAIGQESGARKNNILIELLKELGFDGKVEAFNYGGGKVSYVTFGSDKDQKSALEILEKSNIIRRVDKEGKLYTKGDNGKDVYFHESYPSRGYGHSDGDRSVYMNIPETEAGAEFVKKMILESGKRQQVEGTEETITISKKDLQQMIADAVAQALEQKGTPSPEANRESIEVSSPSRVTQIKK